jgi:hypothetical protein
VRVFFFFVPSFHCFLQSFRFSGDFILLAEVVGFIFAVSVKLTHSLTGRGPRISLGESHLPHDEATPRQWAQRRPHHQPFEAYQTRRKSVKRETTSEIGCFSVILALFFLSSDLSLMTLFGAVSVFKALIFTEEHGAEIWRHVTTDNTSVLAAVVCP